MPIIEERIQGTPSFPVVLSPTSFPTVSQSFATVASPYGEALEDLGIKAFTRRLMGRQEACALPNPQVMQVNVGLRCNLGCRHCHLAAGPKRTEEMTRSTMQDCLAVIREQGMTTLDITGGAPEMNPDTAWFIREGSKLAQVIVRTNLVILEDTAYAQLAELYAHYGVQVVCSLPSYDSRLTGRQRGPNVFEASIRVLKRLNDLGYGKGEGLKLDMVHNPVGAFLPPSQADIEATYRRKLLDSYGIVFDDLFAIANNPLGRYQDFLKESGHLQDYMHRLEDAFNPATLCNMMCRNQLSVSWDGRLFDCDFNQALDAPANLPCHISDLVGSLPGSLGQRAIVFGNHCYACCAGAGSSCGGAIA